MVRKQPDPVVELYVVVPREELLDHRVITLSVDIFFINGMPCLLTLSRGIKFVMAEHTPVRTANKLSLHLKRVLQVYYRAGVKVRYVLMDGEFEKVKQHMPKILCNTTAAKEHVTEEEREIRVVKERGRGIINTLPFTHVPKQVKIELVYFIVLWLNAFPAKNRISSNRSPRELIARWKMDYEKHCRVPFGAYTTIPH